MAESQIAGLFMTPEMYRQQQMQADRMRAMEYARLAPEERAAMGFFSAGQGLGRAAGTLLGAQDPQLQRITEQQQMLQGLDVTDSNSLMEAARRASQAGNTQLAMQLAGRAQEIGANAALIEQRGAATQASRAQATRERAPPTTSELTNARAIAALVGPEGSQEYNAAFNREYSRLTTKEGPNTVQQLLVSGKFTPDSVAAYQDSGNIVDLKPINPATKTQVVETQDGQLLTDMSTGAVIANLGRSPDRRSVSNTKVVLPTSTPQDIAKFRRDVQQTIAPQLATITAANQSLALLKDAREANNPVAYNAARAQLARAFSGGGDLSRREIESAGGDPSIIGTIFNTLSTAVTGTPTLEQQRNMRNVAEILRKVAINRARGEIRTQRDLAIRSGSSQSDIDLALRFSEFGEELPVPAAPAGGSGVPSNTFLGTVRQSAPTASVPKRNVTVNY